MLFKLSILCGSKLEKLDQKTLHISLDSHSLANHKYKLIFALILLSVIFRALRTASLDSPVSTASQSHTMTGSTPAPDADLQRQLLSAQLAAVHAAEARAKREDERREEKHQAKMAAFTNASSKPDEPKGETPPQILEVSKYLPGVPRTHLQAIFEGRFDPYNLHKLRALHADEDSGAQQVSLSEKGELEIHKLKGKLKDYGSTTIIWQDGFLNYTQAASFFFESTSPALPRVRGRQETSRKAT